jgi:hypothetical protein
VNRGGCPEAFLSQHLRSLTNQSGSNAALQYPLSGIGLLEVLLPRVVVLFDRHDSLPTQGLPFFTPLESLEMTSEWAERRIFRKEKYSKEIPGTNPSSKLSFNCPTTSYIQDARSHKPMAARPSDAWNLDRAWQMNLTLDPGTENVLSSPKWTVRRTSLCCMASVLFWEV